MIHMSQTPSSDMEDIVVNVASLWYVCVEMSVLCTTWIR